MKKGFILSIVGLIFVTLLAGCLTSSRERMITPTPAEQIDVHYTPAPGTPTATPEDIPPIPKDDIIIYSLDSENLQKIAIPFKIEPGSITLFELVKKIVSSLEDESFSVNIKNAYFEKSMAIVDFAEDGAPGIKYPDYEVAVLDCIAQSIIENYENCTAVIFRVNGEAYSSGNLSFGADEAYLIK
ncbi:MAG: hypothetical protein K6G60_10035 [Lachnospiraceae bacterium]|nr:hypothetical protein [Lachnospiraceae bacterium]